MQKEIYQLRTEKLLPNPYQPRKQFASAEMLSLAESIKANGVLQPLLVRQINNSNYYEIVAGERRLRASILANLQTVPCIIVECDYENSALYSILENIQRANLNYFEEALAIAHLQNNFDMTQEEIGRRLGRSQSSLSNKMRLLKLPIDVRCFIEKENLTERHARALLKLENDKDMWDVLKIVKDKHLNVEQTEALVDKYITPKQERKQKKNIVFRDLRIFVNSVNKAIETMKASGINAHSDKTETDEYIEFTVRIPKNAEQCVDSA